MKNSTRILLIILPLLTLLFGLSCSPSEVTGGSSGTEVSATVFNTDGTPAVNALVRLRPATFLKNSRLSTTYCKTHTILDTRTDNNGFFKISPVEPDSYTVEAIVNDTLATEAQCDVDNEHDKQVLPPLTVAPVSEFTGNVSTYYGTEDAISIQPYGLERTANADSNGEFRIKVPHGKHTFHIAAYQHDDTLREHPFEIIDLLVECLPGEKRNAGSVWLRPPPPVPCEDGSCDSAVVVEILSKSGNSEANLAEIIQTNSSGRITAFNGQFLNFNNGISSDITRLSELRVLDLSNTRLRFIFPNIGALLYLETVRISNNRLTFFSSTIGECTQLRDLDLSNNDLSELPASLSSCLQLTNLNVSSNHLCDLESPVVAWVDERSSDEGWLDSQRCP